MFYKPYQLFMIIVSILNLLSTSIITCQLLIKANSKYQYLLYVEETRLLLLKATELQ